MSVIVARLLGKPCLLELVNLVHENDRKLFQSETYARYGASWQLVSKNKQLDFCLTRYCLNPKNSTQSATSSIFQERQEGAPSESKVGSNPLSNLVGVFLELLTSPSAIFVYRGNSVLSQKSLRYQISNLEVEGFGGCFTTTGVWQWGRDMLKPVMIIEITTSITTLVLADTLGAVISFRHSKSARVIEMTQFLVLNFHFLSTCLISSAHLFWYRSIWWAILWTFQNCGIIVIQWVELSVSL